ncbi:MAG: bifunctional phosphopantothenoylcysteine decarboxylase/phosphopantothenate--cysteine ligase CoaBC [Pseudomonadota bacterium]|jgi:phosphopantothenoylcysteine decarboxylase/phosphopantothenate--cysteine ligase
MNLAGKKIVLGLTGGIACYKAAELARGLVKAGASVQVVMTEASRHFITPVTMQALSGKPVYTDQWDSRISNNMAHIDLSRDADAIVIAPCSADFMRKLVHGAADDLLSTLCLARPATVPMLVAPAMNVEMWENPATQRNVEQLRKDGVSLLGPVAGDQACGETGLGRMMEPEQLLEDLSAFFYPKLLAGKKVMITAGPTFEPIDPVRGITNLSSGKMGYAIARVARAAGAEVTLVSGPTALSRPAGVTLLPVTTAREMHDAVMSQISGQDLFIGVAAVADWRVASVSEQKIKKQAGQTPSLQFEQNPDILAAVAALPSPPYCVGFAAESEDLLAHGAAKREKKHIPLLVGNIGHQTFGKDDNELVLFDAQGHHHLPRASKDALAQTLIKEIAQRLYQRPSA